MVGEEKGREGRGGEWKSTSERSSVSKLPLRTPLFKTIKWMNKVVIREHFNKMGHVCLPVVVTCIGCVYYMQGTKHDGLLRSGAQHAQSLRRYVCQFLHRAGRRDSVGHCHDVGYLQV